jgi:hypothetical protein
MEGGYFCDFADEPNSTTDVVVYSGTVHTRGDISHIEADVAGGTEGRGRSIRCS